MRIQPFVIGRGRSSNVIRQALAILSIQMQDVKIEPSILLDRSEAFRASASGLSLAVIANPHGLHSARILEADRAGFHGILTEKPSCTTPEQAAALRNVSCKTAVLHVYRQMWGPQTLKKMIEHGDFGELISIEGRHWSASSAERAIKGVSSGSWKNTIDLSGPSDTLLDVGTHWADMAIYLAGTFPSRLSGWASYANAERPHRDTHAHLIMEYHPGFRSMSSFSKNSHGSTNEFEITVFGTRASATWRFISPDEILFGEGRDRRAITRDTTEFGTNHPPFHGAGWLEGYVEIARQLVLGMTGAGVASRYPTLGENIKLIEALLAANILRAN